MDSSQQAYDGALDLYQRAQELHADFLKAEAAKDALAQAECGQSLLSMSPPGWWEHWKSGNEPGMTEENDHWKFYVVRGLEQKSGVFEVDYVALYAPHAGEPFTRSLLDPKEGFLVPINRPAWEPRPYVGPRFRLIRPLDPQECERLIREAVHIAVYSTREAAYARVLRALGAV